MDEFSIGQIGTLRPLIDLDLEMVLNWRNAPIVRQNMYTQHEISLAEHRAWWKKTRKLRSELYFVFADNFGAQGVVSFNGMNLVEKSSYWAFYASTDAPKGTGSRMEFLALEFFFGCLGMRKLSCEVLSTNEGVLKLHRKFGFEEEGMFREQVSACGEFTDVCKFALFKESWHARRDRIQKEIVERISQ